MTTAKSSTRKNRAAAPFPHAGDRLLNVDEVADLLGRAPQTVRWMIHQGTAPESALIGGRRMFWASTVATWIDAQFNEQNGHAA